jgi:PatG C-terminal
LSSLDADSASLDTELESAVEEIDSATRLESSPPEGRTPPLPTTAQPVPPSPSFVYALGQVQPRFPSLAVEKEFVQGTGRADTAGLTDREALRTVLSDRANRYLVRQLCWVFVIEGLETYLLRPRDPADYELLVEAVRPSPDPTDVDVVIGIQGSLAPPEACNGLVVPIVVFDQLYSFDRDALLGAIPRPDDILQRDDKKFRRVAAELLDRILQLADNAGATDEHRALNYLAVRYPGIYAQTAASHAENASLSAVDVRPSRLSGVRKVVDVTFSYTHRQTDVTDKYFVRVDVTEEFPFLVTKLSPFYER